MSADISCINLLVGFFHSVQESEGTVHTEKLRIKPDSVS